jgi:hypothetical protein
MLCQWFRLQIDVGWADVFELVIVGSHLFMLSLTASASASWMFFNH